MDEKKKLILTIIVGVAGLFFLVARFCLPLAKDNTKLKQQYRELTETVRIIEELSKEELNSLSSRLDTAIADFARGFTSTEKMKLVEQLTLVPADANITFSQITHRAPTEYEGYQAFPIDVNIKAQFYDFIKYLAHIEISPLLIVLDNLSLRKTDPAGKSLDIAATFLGFNLTKAAPEESKYLEEKYSSLDREYLENLLEPVKPLDNADTVLALKNYNPFLYKSREQDEFGAVNMDNFLLQGITCVGDKKVALINETMVREGEQIGGMEVVEIGNYRVVLEQAGKKYILKMGVKDGFDTQ